MASARYYLQCVLAAAKLWGRGVAQFRSDKAGAWYLLLLNDKLDGLAKENMKSKLKDLGGEDIDMEDLKRPAAMHRAAPAPADDGIAGGDGAPPAPPVAPADDAPPEPSSATSATSSSSSSSSSISESTAGDAGEEEVYEPPEHILGVRVFFEEHRDRGDRGLRVRCCEHAHCRKYASLRRDPHGFGPRCAEIFLGAWLLLPAPTAAEHKRRSPTKAEMELFLVKA